MKMIEEDKKETENSIDFFTKNKDKLVHVDYDEFDFDSGMEEPKFIEGKLNGKFKATERVQGNYLDYEYIVIENDTDYVKLIIHQIKRIYLKKVN